MLNKRDRAIIADLTKFRVMDRDSIAELHFSGLKNPQFSANNVLLRLLRQGEIQRSTAFVPYCYFGPNVQMKKNSAKIPHFLAILDVYKEMRALGRLETFLVEPKYGRKSEGAEPDIYATFRKTGFFIEVQKTVYSDKQMRAKLDRYIDLFNGNHIAKPFPHVVILSDQRYAVDGDYPFRVFQAESFSGFINSLSNVERPKNKQKDNAIKIKIG